MQNSKELNCTIAYKTILGLQSISRDVADNRDVRSATRQPQRRRVNIYE